MEFEVVFVVWDWKDLIVFCVSYYVIGENIKKERFNKIINDKK